MNEIDKLKNENLEGNYFKEIPIPKFKWKNEFLLYLIPFLFEVVSYFIPNNSIFKENMNLVILLGIILLFLPILIPTFIWLIKALASLIKRAKTCNNNIKKANNLIEEAKHLNENLSDIIAKLLLRSLVTFELEKAYSNDKGIFLIVRKNPKIQLVVDDRLMIVDEEQKDVIIGVFSIIRINQDNYYALAEPGLDPIWAGYVIENRELNFFPYIKAYHFKEGDNYGN